MTTVRRRQLTGNNLEQTQQTVAEMWGHVLSYSPDVRAVAEAILRQSATQRAPDYLRAAAIYAWVQRFLAYVPDHLLVEELHGPQALLQDIADYGDAFEDCDGWVILMGALWASIGIDFRIIVTSSRPDRAFDHVFLMALTGAGPIYADAIHGAKFGWHVPKESITNYLEFPVPASLEALTVTPGPALQDAEVLMR